MLSATKTQPPVGFPYTKRLCLILLWPLLSYAGSAPGVPHSERKATLLWRVELREVLRRADIRVERRDNLSGANLEAITTHDLRLEFLSNGKVALTSRQSQRDANPDGGDKYTLVSLFFEVSSGQLTDTIKWPASPDGAKLFALHDGGFLVWAGNELIRYSSDFKVLRERRLQLFGSRDFVWQGWEVEVAPGGRVAMVSSSQMDGQTREKVSIHTWIDVDTFQEKLSLKGHEFAGLAPAENAVAKTFYWRDKVGVRDVMISEGGGQWRVLLRGHAHAAFVRDDLLVVTNHPNRFAVVNRRGEVIFEGRLTWAELASLTVKPSLNCNRFVILDSKKAIPLIQKRQYFDYRYFAKVFDIQSQAMIAEIPLGTQAGPHVDVSLSPDGSRLAVLAGSELALYELPKP